MASLVTVRPIPAEEGSWPAEVDRLRSLLGAPHNPSLFPPHYLKFAFPKIGGRAVTVEAGPSTLGVGFLFPRLGLPSQQAYVLRFQRVPGAEVDPGQVLAAVQLATDLTDLEFYDPEAPQLYCPTAAGAGPGAGPGAGSGGAAESDGLQIGRPDRSEAAAGIAGEATGLQIGRPDRSEAAAIRALQQRIWDSEDDFLYPADIHSEAFTACSSLVCRADGQLAGFAFGFHKHGGTQLPPAWAEHHQGRRRLESQLLGVTPGVRRRGLGSLLKRAQASEARLSGIDIINWTVDPLQFGNAILNFGQLRAVAGGFTPDLYPFRNGLNQVAASRLEICWLINSSRVARPVSGGSGTTIPKLNDLPDVEQANSGWEHTRLDCRGDAIAFEIPADWTALQASDVEAAQRWRESTDRLFLHYLGLEPGRYLITGVAQQDERRFLLAQRVTDALLAQLAFRDA